MQGFLLLLAPLGICLAQAQSLRTRTLSACATESGVVNCLRDGTTVPWTTLTAQATSVPGPVTAPSTTQTGATTAPTAVSNCHMHGTTQFCFAGTAEYEVLTQATATGELPAEYTGCHSHGSDLFCFSPAGGEVEIIAEGAAHGDASATATPAVTSAAATGAATASAVTALSGCHMHSTEQFCMGPSGTEYLIKTSATATQDLPASYTGCHSHGSQLFCMTPSGAEVLAKAQTAEGESSSTESSNPGSGVSCHSHAGVPHCVDKDGNTVEQSCDVRKQDYNIPLRIGLVFVILATASIGVFTPVFLSLSGKMKNNGMVITIIKQFGTGVIISTALVHLFTHAGLMFANKCLGGLKYEATTAAIVMAGVMISFVPEYVGARIFLWRVSKQAQDAPASPVPDQGPDSKVAGSSEAAVGHHMQGVDGQAQAQSPALQKLKVNIMEAGIIFHSLLIGLTLVVADDSGFITLFIVILFHQNFEGLALGSRIGELQIKLAEKMIMATAFALVTPIGMAIGIGVLNQFNGNDPATIIAIGTLDALSAGILLYVGLVEMLAQDWMHGELARAPMKRIIPAAISLVAGLVLMSVLGKWA